MDGNGSERRPQDDRVFGQAAPAGAAEARIVEGEGEVPAAPPIPMGAPRHRRGQWAIALAVVMCVVLVSAVTAFVIVGAGAPKSLTAKFAPRDTVAFATIRADLPGDQRQKVASFLGHFPGFQDKAQFDTYFDKAMNELTNRIGPEFQYSTELKPWMGGELSVAVSLPAGSATAGTGRTSAVAIVSVKDRAKAQAWLDARVAASDIRFVNESYAGEPLQVSRDSAYVLLDTALIAGTTAGVKAALDTKTKGSLADVAAYRTAQSQFSGDRLAFGYVDYKKYATEMLRQSAGAMQEIQAFASEMPEAFPSLPSIATIDPKCIGQVPEWMAGSLRVESGHAVMDFAVPATAGSKAAANSGGSLASSLPGDTLAVYEIHSVGAYLRDMLKLARTSLTACVPGGTPPTALDQADGILAGLDWMGDGAFVAVRDGAKLGGGIVVQASDAKGAKGGVDSLLNLLTLARAGGADFVQTAETYKDTKISVFTTGSGAQKQTFAIASVGKLVVVGLGSEFVRSIVDTDAGSSLASKASYKDAMALVGSSNAASGYVDVQALVDTYAAASAQADRAYFEREMKPYLAPLRSAAFATVGGDVSKTRLVVILK